MPVGSFEIVGGLQDRTIYVYWQQITKTKRNGEDFRYSVTEVFESGNVRYASGPELYSNKLETLAINNTNPLPFFRPINPVNVTATYAVFPHISLQNHSFYVASQNEMGFSPNTSSVFVAHHDKRTVSKIIMSFCSLQSLKTLSFVINCSSWLPASFLHQDCVLGATVRSLLDSASQ